MSLGRVLTDDPGMWKRIVSWCHYLQNVLEITLPRSGESITSQALSPQEAHSLVETSSVPWLTRMAFLVQLRTNQSSEPQALTACSQPRPGRPGPSLTLHFDELQVRAILQSRQVTCCAIAPGALLPFLLQLQLQFSNLKRKERLISQIQSLKWNRYLAWWPHLRIRPQIIHSETFLECLPWGTLCSGAGDQLRTDYQKEQAPGPGVPVKTAVFYYLCRSVEKYLLGISFCYFLLKKENS